MAQIEAEYEAGVQLELPASLHSDIGLPYPVQSAIRLDDQAQFNPAAYVRDLAARLPGDQSFVLSGQRGFQPLLPAAWINAWLGVNDTDGTIQAASARGDGLWPPPADVLEVRTGHTFMAEKTEVIRQTAHFLAHGRFAR